MERPQEAHAARVESAHAGPAERMHRVDDVDGVSQAQAEVCTRVLVGAGVVAVVDVQDGVARPGKPVLLTARPLARDVDVGVDVAMGQNQYGERPVPFGRFITPEMVRPSPRKVTARWV